MESHEEMNCCSAQNKESQESEAEQDCCEQCPELDACKKELEEWKGRALRIGADFENFKKRIEKDQIVWQRMVQADILLQLLEIVDNFDRALAQEKDDSGKFAGFALIRKELQKLLERYDVKEIADAKQFDPALHESVMSVKSEAHQPGAVVEVLQKGYMFKDQVLRPAKVSIAE
jgi:molecular chaperone GrpE